jgi:hypothetical protein
MLEPPCSLLPPACGPYDNACANSDSCQNIVLPVVACFNSGGSLVGEEQRRGVGGGVSIIVSKRQWIARAKVHLLSFILLSFHSIR